VVESRLSSSELNFGHRQILFMGPVPTSFGRNYEVSSDGKRFLLALPATQAAITVVLNWRQSLGK
jgi:hypothetical protein